MKLLRIEVKHFGCIRSAHVELGPGLNVLYGPNDIGKTTLARALRAALLLPHGSSAADAFVPWVGGESPEVTVTFQTEPQRYYRVHKRFGDRGASFLEASKDGVDFHTEKKAREVDGHLRELLRWGIRAPGGQAAPRGLPESFLGTVLLGEQADVTSILRQTLARDTDESGRKRLTEALQAFAQDPLFKAILDRAQSKVDEAFSATGKRKRGRGSPFTQVSEAVRQAKDELDRLMDEQRQSKEAEERVRVLSAERDRLAALRDDARAARAALQAEAQRGAARRAVEAELVEERARRQASAQLEQRGRELREELAAAETTLAALRAELEALKARRDEAASALEQAKDAARLRGDEAARERQLAKSQLETQRERLSARLAELRGQAEAAARGARLAGELASAELERAEAQEAHVRVVEARDALEARRSARKDERAALELAERLARLDALRAEVAELEALAAQVDDDRRVAAGKREQAAALLGEVPEGFPSRERVRAMEQVEHELAVAEARLGGGLSLRVRLREPMALKARVDGKARKLKAGELVELDAERAISLVLGDVAELDVAAGVPEARAEVERARARYEAEVAATLSTWRFETLEALREALATMEQRQAEAERLRREAESLAQRAEERAARLGKLPELRRDEAAAAAELRDEPGHERARALLDEHGASGLATRLAAARRDLAKAEDEAAKLEAELRASQARVGALEERCRGAEAAFTTLGAEPEGGWAGAAQRLRADLETADAELGATVDAIARLEGERSTTEREAERAVQRAEQALQEAERAVATALARRETTASVSATRRGQLDELEPRLASIDADAERARVAELEARLAELPAPMRDVSEAELAALNDEVERAERAVLAQDAELLKARGALETVGGEVIRERVEQAREALRLAERAERDVDVEYGAWQLLLEKLRDAESTEGKHLGEALSVPVSARFESLTAQRYGKLHLGPELEAEGIFAAGQLRAIASLSVGTQEQLAALLRLTVAEHLGSALVLDDQLTQTDPTRSTWFRTVLRERAANVQILVITCHPTSYVDEDELPAPGAIKRDRAAGLVSVIDLERVLERIATSPAPAQPHPQ